MFLKEIDSNDKDIKIYQYLTPTIDAWFKNLSDNMFWIEKMYDSFILLFEKYPKFKYDIINKGPQHTRMFNNTIDFKLYIPKVHRCSLDTKISPLGVDYISHIHKLLCVLLYYYFIILAYARLLLITYKLGFLYLFFFPINIIVVTKLDSYIRQFISDR